MVARHFLTFVLCVRCEGEGVWRDDQAPQFAQEDSKHCHRQALVLRVIQEVDRAAGSSSWYLEATCYRAHTLTTLCIFRFIHSPWKLSKGLADAQCLNTARSTLDPTCKFEIGITQRVCSYSKSYLSNPGRPLCVSPFFMRLDKMARISMTTSCKGKHASEFCHRAQPVFALKMSRRHQRPTLNHGPPAPPQPPVDAP